jgi:creatinine amidohydrolase
MMRLERMTWPEVRTEIEAGTPIVLPVGAIEQHGPHLPLGTDGFIPEHIAAAVADLRRLIVAPPLFYGAYSRPRSGGGRHFPGSVGLPGRVLEQVVRHLVEDWLRQGFRKVVVLNGHFENAWTLLEGVEQAIEAYRDTSKVLLVNWWDQVDADDVRRIFGDTFPGWATEHASITETSMLEAFAPDLVRTEHKADGGAKRLVSYDIFPPPEDILWPNGIGYSAVSANAATGKELTTLLTERLTAILDTEFRDNAHLFLLRHPRLPQVLEEVPGRREVL